MNKFHKLGLGLLTLLFSAASQAVVVTSVTDEISAASVPIAAIGSAVLLVIVGIKVFKWIRRAM